MDSNSVLKCTESINMWPLLSLDKLSEYEQGSKLGVDMTKCIDIGS
jgi:hypothetical protein